MMRSVYHEDAVDDHGSFRLPAYEAIDRIIESVLKTKVSQHHLTNITIQIQGNSARSESYVTCHLYEESAAGTRLRMLGLRYLDCLDRRQRVWRISERLVVHDWSVCLPPLDEWSRANFLRQGTRDHSDPSYFIFERFL